MGNILSFQQRDTVKKAACLFAGLGHLQPLLLATTNSHYLLDRFCMERCCSGEYISRIVTSLIFMEILSILVVRIVLIIRPTGLRTIMDLEEYSILKTPPSWLTWLIRTDPTNPGQDATNLVSWSKEEEKWRDPISAVILLLISIGYVQIFYAFTTGGKKGHMHWFYSSLLIQHFLNSLIAGSIGFWDVGLALWYLVTLPMAPIVVFFYQLMIHSWIRNNGPRDAEYLVVECQIWLALCLSCIATIFWTIGYVIPPEGAQLDLATPNTGSITAKDATQTLQVYTVSTGGATSKTATIKSTNTGTVTVRVHSITVTLNGGTPTPNPVIVYPKESDGTLTVTQTVTATVTAAVKNNSKVIVKIKNSESSPLWSENVTGATQVTIQTVKLALDSKEGITVPEAAGQTGTTVQVTGYTCYPHYGYYIYQTSASNDKLWNENWDGGSCTFAEYYKSSNSPTPALLKLYIRDGNSKIRYYGTTNAGTTDWKKIDNEDVFKQKLKELVRTGDLTSTGLREADSDKSPTSNIDYRMAFHWPTWYPLLMQGLSVGAVGSIFPNLIPKTLTYPKTTRNLSVINMFLVTLPHIFNVMLGDMDLLGWIGVGDDWDEYKGLMYDDLMSEREPIVERALTLLTPDLATDRFRRIARGMQMSVLRMYPPLEEQNYDPFVPYLAPFIEEAKFQIQEEEELLGYHPVDRRVFCGGTTGFGDLEPGMHFLVSIPNLYGAAIGNIKKK